MRNPLNLFPDSSRKSCRCDRCKRANERAASGALGDGANPIGLPPARPTAKARSPSVRPRNEAAAKKRYWGGRWHLLTSSGLFLQPRLRLRDRAIIALSFVTPFLLDLVPRPRVKQRLELSLATPHVLGISPRPSFLSDVGLSLTPQVPWICLRP